MKNKSLQMQLLLLFIFVIQNFSFTLQAQTVTTIAGSTAGNLDGIGTVAQFNMPAGVVAYNGSLYIADYNTHRIRRLNLVNNEVITIAGSTRGANDGIGTAAQFNNPAGMVYHDNYLYIAEFTGNRIRKLNLNTYEASIVAGSGVRGSVDATGVAAQFNGPVGVVYANNYLYVSEQNGHRIRRIALANNEVTTIAGSTVGYNDAIGTAAQFSAPSALLCNGNDLYVTEVTGNRIRKIDLTTNQVTTPYGSVAGTNDGIGTNAQFNGPWGLAYYDNHLYVTDQRNNRIRKINLLSNEVTTLAGSTSGYTDAVGTAAQFSNPFGITYYNDQLYVGEYGGHRIRSVTLNTVLPVVWGNISAIIKNEKLELDFTTQTETNNSAFAIEISADGKTFKKIKQINSLAIDGNSATALSYHVSMDASAAAGALVGITIIGIFGTAYRRLLKYKMATAILLILALYACNKNSSLNVDDSSKDIFIRVAQIDKDGSRTYSKVVRVVRD